MEDMERCTCGEEAVEPHTCPYKEEINDDSESECECCAFCEQECCWDI